MKESHRCNDSPIVSNTNSILVGQFNEFIWVRCDGKGSFHNSPEMKHWIDGRLKKGVQHLVIDLAHCTAMDSTFMGTIAAAAMKLMQTGGLMEIAHVSDKNRESLKDLGLDSIMVINPSEPVWVDQLETIYAKLSTPKSTQSTDSTQHIFDAHKQLCEADADNTSKFNAVLDCLEAELASRKK